MAAFMANLRHPIIGARATTRLRPSWPPTTRPSTLPMKSKHRMIPIRNMSFSETGPAVAIVAGDAAYGADFFSLIAERDFPYRSLKILGCEHKAGETLKFEGKIYTVEELNDQEKCFSDVDIAMFCGGRRMSDALRLPLCEEKVVILVDDVRAFKLVETVVGGINWAKKIKP